MLAERAMTRDEIAASIIEDRDAYMRKMLAHVEDGPGVTDLTCRDHASVSTGEPSDVA